MLSQDTKRKIDSARNILVGKVPDPKAQVEQITTALIYKFMDDMDKEAIELGGKARFFINGFEKYAWTKLMDPKVGGQERLDLYAEAITKMWQNSHLPQLFRDIFKDSFLPYRSPETLSMFLKEINGFSYDHSEDLGDAFEYLLSILGSQGDAGQFRTPRHIIDFIVEAVEPKKDEIILDPACGTAGFLISAYKHILKQNRNKPLTPDEKKKLMKNLSGYDISPDMVKLSKVNMYLHGFAEPKIYEYDTLSSEEKWDEMFDVMMANPPFMSPKGGIRPHKRFSVQANRSEVLFVDYIIEHLRPKGRAGIIVPEGIIFQSAGAYKQLRKMLVEDGLFAVVSLPQGVFNPYAGVKTSILLFDNEVAKKTTNILFLKIQNDGFDLGAQRREHSKNDLPVALEIIKKYKSALKDGKNFKINESEKQIAHLVAKEKIAETGDYNLSGDRYRMTVDYTNAKWPLVELGEIANLITDGTHKTPKYIEKGVRFISTANIVPYSKDFDYSSYEKFISKEEHDEISRHAKIQKGDVLISKCGTIGRTQVVRVDYDFSIFVGLMLVRAKKENVLPEFLEYLLNQNQTRKELEILSQGASRPTLIISSLKKYKIPLPPLEIQKQIVAELENYQKVIEGARAVSKNWKPKIDINPDWKRVKLGEVVDFTGGYAFKSEELKKEKSSDADLPVVKIGNVGRNGEVEIEDAQYFPNNKSLEKFIVYKDDIVIAMTGATVGKVAVSQFDNLLLNQRVGLVRTDESKLSKYFLKSILFSDDFYAYCQMTAGGGAQGNISPNQIKEYEIPLPSLAVQKKIVEKIEAERALVEGNKKLIEIYEQKTKETLDKLWSNNKFK